MASQTPNLNLHKKDPVTDGNDTFNIQTMMNDNWDKIDEAMGGIDIPDASLEIKGKVQLSSAVNSEAEDRAATPKAVKAANDAGTAAQTTANAANSVAAAAQTAANNARTAATAAQSTATSAQTAANGALSAANTAQSGVNNLSSTRLPTRVNNGQFEYMEGSTWKKVNALPTGDVWAYVDPVRGNDNIAVSSYETPFKTVNRAVEWLPKVSAYERIISFENSAAVNINEYVKIEKFTGGSIELLPLGETVTFGYVSVSDCYGCTIKLNGNGQRNKWIFSPVQLGQGSGVPPISVSNCPGCILYIRESTILAGDNVGLSLNRIPQVCMDDVRINAYGTYTLSTGISVEESTLYLEGVSTDQATSRIKTGIKATMAIVFGDVYIGQTRTSSDLGGQFFS